jgi:carbonic anhydrase/acetyltransferase-like protein (isoleucine patch superfamily)
MIISHLGRTPVIDPEAWVAPDATVCGDVTIAAGARVMHGARIIAEGGAIVIGRSSIVLENAVIRATADHDCTIGDHVLIGPGAHVVGATVENEVFLATGAAVFHASHVGRGSEVRIHGVVHLRTRLEAGATVPVGWIACGDPARLFSPDRHDDLWAVQKLLDFPRTAYGLDRDTPDLMRRIAERMSERLGTHRQDLPAG